MKILVRDRNTKQVGLEIEPNLNKMRSLKKQPLFGKLEIVLLDNERIIIPGSLCNYLTQSEKVNLTDIFANRWDIHMYPELLEYERIMIAEALAYAVAHTLDLNPQARIVDFLVATRKSQDSTVGYTQVLIVFFKSDSRLWANLYDLNILALVERENPERTSNMYVLIVPITTAFVRLQDNTVLACGKSMCFYVYYESQCFWVVENDLLTWDDFNSENGGDLFD